MFSASKSGQYQGYQISRSVRLRSSASAFFSRTLTTPTNNKIWTWSGWVKRGSLGTINTLFTAYDGVSVWQGQLYFTSSDTLQLQYGGSVANAITSTAVFRDPSAWYHVVVNVNATTTTSNIWVNNQLVANSTSIPTNVASNINGAYAHRIGSHYSGANYSDCYLTEVNFIDGQALTPSSFGAYNAYGVWSPMKYNGTYGTNGFYLNFSDNSAATAAAIGKDSSGNGNNWTPNNISVTAGTTYDSMLDVPTQWADGGNGRGNYATLNPLARLFGSPTTADGNLRTTAVSAVTSATILFPSTGKWYLEGTVSGLTTAVTIGICNTSPSRSVEISYQNNGNKYAGGSATAYGATYTTNDVIGMAVDCDGQTVTFYKNNTSQGSLAFSLSSLSVNDIVAQFYTASGSDAWVVNFGQRPFAYTPPTGFKALNTQNLPTPTIANGANYFAATTYTGTGASRSVDNTVNNVSFQPDFVWVKGRSGATDHALYDAVRGVQLQLESNTTTAETTETTGLTAFNSNGFTVGALAQMNTNTATYVGWQWKANGTPAVTNTAGSITSTVSAGATQGFSVVTYTGTGANATVGHGLGVAPRMIIVKSRSLATDWPVYHASLTAAGRVFLNGTNAYAADSAWNSTAPTSSVFSIGPTGFSTNNSGQTYVAYCFAAVAGFSAFGSYTGNGSTDGPFVFCGFRPRFIMFKRTDVADDWQQYDTSRDSYNVAGNILFANLSNAETASPPRLDILSNGFKARTAGSGTNANGGTYIYAAFAENPTKYALAR